MCIVNPWIYSKYSSMWCSNRQSLRFCSKFSAAHKAARPIRNKKTFQKDDVICTINRCNTKHRLLGTIIAIGAGLAYTFRHKYWMPIAHATQLQQLETSNRNQFNFFTDIVEQSAPAVVCIGLRDEQRVQQDDDECLSHGSGFIIYSNGLILTNAHVVLSKPDTTVVVKLYDGRSFDARIETVDQSADLAVVQIKCRDLPTLKLGRSSDLRAGELVMAMGCPMTLENSVTVGVISSVQKTSQDLALEGNSGTRFIQTDATLNTGSSGGPLINLNGEVIGITSKRTGDSPSFAIPIDHVRTFLEERQRSIARGIERLSFN